MKTHVAVTAIAAALAIGAGGTYIGVRTLGGSHAATAAPGAQGAMRNDPLQPIVHAQAAGVLKCAEGIVRAARSAIEPGVSHKAVSTWISNAPDDRIFASIAALDYKVATAPRALSVITGTPTANAGCDTSAVQIHPTARSCAAIDADLGTAGGRTRSDLNGTTLVKTADGRQRHVLMPMPNGQGCVIVAIAITATPSP